MSDSIPDFVLRLASQVAAITKKSPDNPSEYPIVLLSPNFAIRRTGEIRPLDARTIQHSPHVQGGKKFGKLVVPAGTQIWCAKKDVSTYRGLNETISVDVT